MSKSTAVSEQQLKLKPCGRCSQKLKSSCAHTSGINGQLNPYFPLLTITGEICPHCMCYYVNIHFVYICFPMRSHEGDHGRWCNALSGVIRLAVCVCVCVCGVCHFFEFLWCSVCFRALQSTEPWNHTSAAAQCHVHCLFKMCSYWMCRMWKWNQVRHCTSLVRLNEWLESYT